ncbi:hypothetical protein [Novosphingobium sp. BL-8H]|uniref:hypothetical protein n=1 Tax=Novosphingobium sp. BL-8H TaxID=3127640 RepID=UPI003756FC28
MRVFRHIILWLLAASVLTATAVHAQEFPMTAALDCSGFVHDKGDPDESQGDADKGVPHHHANCHTSFAAAPQIANDLLVLRPAKLPNRLLDTPAVERWAVGPDLRPPIA